MSGSNAIASSYYPSLGADQYWQNYWQYSQGLTNQTSGNTATQSGQTTQGTTNSIFENTASTAAQGTTATVKQEATKKGSNVLGKIALFGLGATAIVAGVAMHNGGGIRNAFKTGTVWTSIKKGLGITTSASGLSKKFTISTADGTCTIPDRLNYIRDSKIAKKLGMNISSFTSKTVPDGATIREYTFKVSGNTIKVKNGVIQKITNGSGKNITEKIVSATEGSDLKFLNNIKDCITKVGSKETKGITGLSVKSYKYTKDGVTSLFRLGKSGQYNISSSVSNKFLIGSDAVKAYAENHSNAKALLEAFKKGKLKDLKVASAEYQDKTIGGIFKIINGKIDGIKIGKEYYSSTSEKFQSLKYDYPKIFEKVLTDTKKYINQVYTV